MGDDFELTEDPILEAGRWSNHVQVLLGREEVVVDFATLHPVEPRGVIIARISLPPGAALQLRDDLIRVLEAYTYRDRP